MKIRSKRKRRGSPKNRIEFFMHRDLMYQNQKKKASYPQEGGKERLLAKGPKGGRETICGLEDQREQKRGRSFLGLQAASQKLLK